MRRITIAVILCGLLAAGGYWLFYTTHGSRWAADRLIDSFAEHQDSRFEQLEGDLARGLTLQNLKIGGIKDLPEGSLLKIQRLFVDLTSFSLDGIVVEVENARLLLPYSDPIVVTGEFREGAYDCNIFSRGFSVRELIRYLPNLKSLIPIRGDVDDIDIHVTGSYRDPVVQGRFQIERFVYKGFELKDVPVEADVQLSDIRSNMGLKGTVSFAGGLLRTKRVSVELDGSELVFTGPWDDPLLNISGEAVVERTRIFMSLKGTVKKPDLNLTSTPPNSRERLMVMLATGKSWRSVDGAVDNGLDSAALTADFIDYFFFAGKANRFARLFGINEFSVEFEEGRRGVAAKKSLTDNLDVGYGVEQQGNETTTSTKQTIQGEYQVTDQLTVGVEKGVTKTRSLDALDPQQEQTDENKVYMEYKKRF